MFLLDIPVIKFFMEIFSRFFPTEGFFSMAIKHYLKFICVYWTQASKKPSLLTLKKILRIPLFLISINLEKGYRK